MKFVYTHTHTPEADTVPSWLVPSDTVCLCWLKWMLGSSSASIPSSMDDSVTLTGNGPLALRTTTGGRGSSRHPSTWRHTHANKLSKMKHYTQDRQVKCKHTLYALNRVIWAFCGKFLPQKEWLGLGLGFMFADISFHSVKPHYPYHIIHFSIC